MPNENNSLRREGSNVIDESACVLWREYPFAKGASATTLVFRGSALRDWLLARLETMPPSIVVPAHGAPVDAADVAEQMRAQIRRL